MPFRRKNSNLEQRSVRQLGIFSLMLFSSYAILTILGPFVKISAEVNTWDFATPAEYTYGSEIEVLGGYVQLGERGSPAWLDSSWQYRKKVTIDADSISGDLVNFRLHIKLDSTNFDFQKSQINGYDIRFTNADGLTLLDFEREYHSCEKEIAEYWVEVPAVSNTIDTDLFMYYSPSEIICGSSTFLNSYTAGTQNEVFLDQTEIESSTGLNFIANPAVKEPDPLFEAGVNSATWDHDKNFNSVLKIDETYKMWYAAVSTEPTPRAFQAYATSPDGITWSKPNLGLVNYGGNTNNNIYLGSGAFNAAVSYDPGAPADRRYVAVQEQRVGDTSGGDIYVYKSANGINWTHATTLVPPVAYVEAKELVQRPDGRYIAYYAFNHPLDIRKLGAIISDTSDPTGTWTNIGTTIESSTSANQKYSIGVEYVGETYYGMVADYNSTTENIEIDLYVSRDGLSWTLVRDKWVPRGTSGQWDDSMIMNGKSLIQEGNDWRFYYSGFAENHAASLPRDARVGLATIGYQRIGQVVGNGSLITDAFQPSDDLFLNGEFTSNFKVELLNAVDNTVISGYSKDDFDSILGNTYSTEATWGGISAPTNQELKVKFYLDDLNLDTLAKADASNANATWSSGYASVLHMEDDPNSTTAVQDSTSNNNDGAKILANSPSLLAGIIQNGQIFDGVNDKINIVDAASIQPTTEFTIQGWVYPTNCQPDRIVSKWDGNTTGTDNGGIIVDTYDGTVDGCGLRLVIVNSSDALITSGASGNVLTQNEWNHVAARFASGAMTLYVNGVQVSTGALGQASIVDTTFAWGIGEDGSGPGSSPEYFTGSMDEIRISLEAQSADMISATYLNIDTPSTFMSLGTEESIYSNTNPSITPNTSVPFTTLSGFTEVSNKNGGEIKYQLSNNDGTTWYWYSAGWIATVTGFNESNTATEINSNIGTFPVGDNTVLYRAYLHSDGTQLVQLDAVQLTYSNDAVAPSLNLTAISPDPGVDTTPTFTGVATDSLTSVSSVEYQIDATNGSWSNCIAVDGSFDEAIEDFSCSITASQSDGLHTVYVRATDSSANTTTPGSEATDIFTIDTISPTGSIGINGGAVFTNNADVSLALTASDITTSVTQMIISSNSDFSGASYESFATSDTFQLPAGDGIKTVYVKFKDSVGNESISYSDSITLDTTGPSGTLSINASNLVTNDTAVTLTINASDALSSVAEMIVSESNTFSGAVYEPYATSRLFNLSSGNGTKTVYIRFKDSQGTESALFSDTIVLDNTGPTGQILINSGSAYTGGTNVSLIISAADSFSDVSEMLLSLLSDFSGASYEAYSTSKAFVLDSSEGNQTVYVKFKDSLNNESATYSDSITLDLTSPTGSVVIEGGSATTTSQQVTLSINATDTISSVTEMIISNNVSFTSSNWETYATTKLFDIGNLSGDKTIYIKFKDITGNESGIYFDDIIKQDAPVTLVPNTTPIITIPITNSGDTQDTDQVAEGITLMLVNTQGHPLVNAKITIPDLNIRAVTNSFGMVDLGDVEFKEYDLSIEYAGKSAGSLIKVNATKSLVTLVLDLSGHELEVIVKDENGNDIENAKVTLYSEPQVSYTNADGVAKFTNIDPVVHRIVVEYGDQVYEKEIDLSEYNTSDITILLDVPNIAQTSVVPIMLLSLLIVTAIGFVVLKRRK